MQELIHSGGGRVEEVIVDPLLPGPHGHADLTQVKLFLLGSPRFPGLVLWYTRFFQIEGKIK